MIRGTVNGRREAIVHLRVAGTNGSSMDLDAIIDTGFTSSLTLPLSTVNALALPLSAAGSAVLADGSTSSFDIYSAEVEWDGESKEVLVYAVGEEPLVGMRLLSGCELRVEVVPGGLVEIKPLP